MKIKQLMKNKEILHIVISREDIQSFKFKDTFSILEQVRKCNRTFKRRVTLSVFGYEDDPRELYAIQEVRDYFNFLDRLFPYWFYYMDLKLKGLDLLVSCVCKIDEITPTSSGTLVKLNIEEIRKFLENHFETLNKLSIELKVSSDEVLEISQEIMELCVFQPTY